jgi:hypothetical protein
VEIVEDEHDRTPLRSLADELRDGVEEPEAGAL